MEKKKAIPEKVYPGEITIDDGNWTEFVNPIVNGEMKVCGTIPRDFHRHPKGGLPFAAKPFDLPLIPESEWEDRLAEQVKSKAQLSDIRDRSGPNNGPIPSTDQNGRGYCWCHSGASCLLLVRALNNQPFVDLSAYFVGCIIKGYRDEGGWGTEGLEFMAKHGMPDSKFWPQRGVKREYDNAETRGNALLHRVEEWMDLPSRSKPHLVTCLLNNIPVVSDFNWWGHSVCTVDLVSINPFKTRIWNSWGDSWSSNGMGVLEGSKAIPDDMIAPRVLKASDR